MTARRIASIWLPRFPMARWERVQACLPRPDPAPWEAADSGPDHAAPLVLAAEGRHGPVIHAANPAALAAGAQPGARVTDFRGLCPDVQVLPADLPGDAAALAKLALWSRRWCPWSATDGADGLVLDTTGSAHLWGGEAGMLDDMTARLDGLGQAARLAVAPTHGAAWAFARYAESPAICPPEALEARLAPLPAAALRLDGETLLVLRRLGLTRVGDLMAIPRATLERRFGRDGKMLATPLRRLDQALGRLPEPVVSPPPPRRFRTVRRMAEPVLDPQPMLPEALAALCAELARAGQGARTLRLELFRVDGATARFDAGTARASRDPDHLRRLLEKRFDGLDAGFGFDMLALEATRVEAQEAGQVRLDGATESDVALATLVDRLSARLGARAVQAAELRESHVPERAEAWVPAMDRPELLAADRLAPGGLGGGGLVAPARERPVKMLPAPERIEVLYAVPEGPPVRFRWRKRPYRIRRHQGPERIAPEWWRDRPGTRLRDYYKVEVEGGARYWLFREGLAGDGRGGDPDWFLHGLFA
ncbi:Y-family DNA polymerase [Jannaschia ovalis]|uniref:DNA polymerase Y family protein n=1 Tax=Jannaschia ovalis TaxID=3038773 RepID=A0ABY8LBF8_9RHOB|nr:DNA polymerase Y family protein [Jannaschia sp. GRR-S6-38]WGH77489.1 DNA polymerase Y family protein [Jannaschia sp. GRR-S6-38]